MLTIKGTPAFLNKTQINGTPAFNIQGTNYALVKRDQDTGQFEPVDSLDTNIGSSELEANYGVWTDKKVTKGHFWWKKTVREADGKVQPDEVKDFQAFRDSQYSISTARLVGQDQFFTMESGQIDVEKSPSGPIATLESNWSHRWGDTRAFGWMSELAPRG